MAYEQMLKGVRQSFASGKTRPIEWRKKQLKSLLKMYEENEAIFTEALHKDLRKPRWEAVGAEIEFNKNDIIGCLRDIDHWTKPVNTERNLVTLLDKTVIKPEPYGVVLIIGSWNYPLHISLSPLAGAISAGNCAIIKPSEISPNTATAIEQLLPRYLDSDCFKVVNGGIKETTELLAQRFDYIFYTGSTQVGQIIRDAANKFLTPCTLELGGKSPVFIDDNCNLDVAAKRIIWGKMMNLGQTCIAPDYILCSEQTETKLVAKAEAIVKQWFGDNPSNCPDVCRIVSDHHFERLIGLMTSSRGQVVFGGNHDRQSRYIDLTIMSGVSPEDRVMQEEIFGPILPVINVNSASEAIEFISQREKPLTLYVFSEDKSVQTKFIDGTSSGGLVINECLMQMSVESLPFGGVGKSGMGAYHGKASFDTFSHYKSILIRDLGFLGEKAGSIRYPPYNYKKLGLLSGLLRNRKLPCLNWLGYILSFLAGVVSIILCKMW